MKHITKAFGLLILAAATTDMLLSGFSVQSLFLLGTGAACFAGSLIKEQPLLLKAASSILPFLLLASAWLLFPSDQERIPSFQSANPTPSELNERFYSAELKGVDPQAQAELATLFSQYPTNPDINRLLADTYKASGRFQEYMYHYSIAVKENPEDVDAQLNLARGFASIGNQGAASSALLFAYDAARTPEELAAVARADEELNLGDDPVDRIDHLTGGGN